VERLIAAAARASPSAGGAASTAAAAEEWGRREGAARRLGGDFVTTRVIRSAVADVALLSAHQQPYVDGATRAQRLGRRREPGAEVAPRMPPPLELPVDGATQEFAAALYRVNLAPSARGRAYERESWARRRWAGAVVDEDEMAIARGLLSTTLSIHRKGER
jgi:hypothetical protein